MRDLNTEISDAFSLVAVLLVFVFAYFTAMWPEAQNTVNEGHGVVPPERKPGLQKEHGDHRRRMTGLVVLSGAVLLLLLPLTVRVIARIRLGARFDTSRAGLLMVDVFLAAMMAIGLRTTSQLSGGEKMLGTSDGTPDSPTSRGETQSAPSSRAT